MTVLITLTTAGTNTGPFDLYSDVDGYLVPFETLVPKASLVSGYVSTLVPNGTTIVRVKSNSVCTNFIDITISLVTTTTTTSSSTSTTTTSSSTTIFSGTEYRLFGYAVDTADACGQTGSYTDLGGLTVYAASSTLVGVTLFYNNNSPLANPYINNVIGNGDRVLFALASNLTEKWVGTYNNISGAISSNVDCTP